MISKLAVPDGTSDYEVKTTLTLAATGGTYIQYLRASTDALSGPAATGTFISVELQNPNPAGTGTLQIYKRESGVLTSLASVVVSCHSGMTLRSVIRGTQMRIYVDDISKRYLSGLTITTGKPGVGAFSTAAGNSMAQVNLGGLDRIAPSQISSQSIGTSEFPNFVDFQWQGSVDDSNGVGVAQYSIYRDGVYFSNPTTSELTDATVSAATTYSYSLRAMDFHLNYSTDTVITVTTPAAGSVDPRRVGVRPTGSYWGAGSEQIDMLSGNLNFSLPLLKAMGRSGWGVSFSLNYNSQLWRQDPGGTWKLGRDVGYGFGWKLMAGALVPYWSNTLTLHHYSFMDSTGAEYRLDINNNGVWSSKEGVYVFYDSNSNRLYFTDGSYWVMGCLSAGTEQDAGARYPTLMEDSNGNQIFILYFPGLGVAWNNSSARLQEIEDVRAVLPGGQTTYRTYQFTYNTDPIPHLTGITNTINTSEAYSFVYLTNQTLSSPFTTPVAFGTTTLLQTVTVNGLNLSHSLQYLANNAGELSKVTLPLGASLRWAYQNFSYVGTRTLREVQNRYLAKASGATETTYTLAHDPGDSGRTVHALTTLNDPSGIGQKAWFFNSTGTWQMGLSTAFEERAGAGQAALRRQDFAWTQDTNGTPYISSVLTTLDSGQSYQQQTKTEQTLDTYGNVTQTKLYDFGNLTTPARTYNHSYISSYGSNYTSRYILNRLTQSTVTDGTSTLILVTNYYDNGVPTSPIPSGLREHDTANYGLSFTYRGNLIQSIQQGVTTYRWYDVTGSLARVNQGGYDVTVSQASGTNNAAPGVLTPNSEANLQTSLTWSSFLGLTSQTEPNASTGTVSYDLYARPQFSSSPHGAITS